jgi:hypothetical protein
MPLSTHLTGKNPTTIHPLENQIVLRMNTSALSSHFPVAAWFADTNT